ncbi:MAG TPA: hypothetical protein GXZ60_02125 [Intrasporangiaceae bacterium]|nr:hypothetical protein [Intrasporangiaceae bacterium]
MTATTDETSAPTEAPTDGATDAGTESATDSETAEETEAGPDRDPVVELEGEAAGIRSDVTLDSCDLTAGAVQATGSVTNSADEARDVVVMIVWLEQESNSSLARKTFVERDLAPGESVDFTLDAELAEDARECVVNARAGTAAE